MTSDGAPGTRLMIAPRPVRRSTRQMEEPSAMELLTSSPS